MTEAASVIWSAITSRLPSGVTASPAGYRLTAWPAGFFVGNAIGESSVRCCPLTVYSWIVFAPPELA